jgi:hypothetical protein
MAESEADTCSAPLLLPDVLHHLLAALGEIRGEEVALTCRAWAHAFASAKSRHRNIATAAEYDKEAGNERFRAGDIVAAINCCLYACSNLYRTCCTS